MKNEGASQAKSVPVRQVGLDSLLEKMSEWSNRIAKRAYQFFADSGFSNGHDLDDWFKAEQELLKPVALDIKDAKGEFVVTAKVPGFEAKDLSVHVNGSHLVIEGKPESAEEKKAKEQQTVYKEHKTQQIYQMIELPAPVLAEKAHGQLKNSVLELKLPKAETPRQTKVAAA
jgi:HSP20 family protein